MGNNNPADDINSFLKGYHNAPEPYPIHDNAPSAWSASLSYPSGGQSQGTTASNPVVTSVASMPDSSQTEFHGDEDLYSFSAKANSQPPVITETSGNGNIEPPTPKDVIEEIKAWMKHRCDGPTKQEFNSILHLLETDAKDLSVLKAYANAHNVAGFRTRVIAIKYEICRWPAGSKRESD
jgi:hypothetical protein